MKRSLSYFLFAALVAGIVTWVPHVHAFDYSFSVNCLSCHNTPSEILEVCGMCHAHGVHSSAAKNDINVSGTTDKTSYAPGETVMVTIRGGYRPPTRARAVLYDQNGTQLAVSECTPSLGGGPGNPPRWRGAGQCPPVAGDAQFACADHAGDVYLASCVVRTQDRRRIGDIRLRLGP